MARLPRFTIPGQPQHVIQRGNNRIPIFGADADYHRFRDCLLLASTRLGVAIHAYVFMTNHVHLLVTPRDATGISRTLQSVGRRYVRYFNDRNHRTGTLWEGRYRATIVDTDEYLFRCYRYIEENPVRAGLVGGPAAYRWSSHAANALGAEDPLILPHERYLALGATPMSRQAAYRTLFADPCDAPSLAVIRYTTHHAWAMGGERFRHEVSRAGRRPFPLPPGPSKIGV